jgi:hypothetical protein
MTFGKEVSNSFFGSTKVENGWNADWTSIIIGKVFGTERKRC